MKAVKKVLLVGSLLLCASKSWAAWGTLPDYKNKLWRSSQTCAGIGSTFFSSGSIVIHQVNVASATLNSSAASFFVVQVTTSDYVGVGVSTPIRVATNVNGTGVPLGWPMPYDIYSDSYTFVNKQGIACTEILWDWLDFTQVDEGSLW